MKAHKVDVTSSLHQQMIFRSNPHTHRDPRPSKTPRFPCAPPRRRVPRDATPTCPRPTPTSCALPLWFSFQHATTINSYGQSTGTTVLFSTQALIHHALDCLCSLKRRRDDRLPGVARKSDGRLVWLLSFPVRLRRCAKYLVLLSLFMR